MHKKISTDMNQSGGDQDSPRSRRNRLTRQRRACQRVSEANGQRDERMQIQNATERARRAARTLELQKRDLRINRSAHVA